jgi:nitrate reductase NapAB chaperone NapD
MPVKIIDEMEWSTLIVSGVVIMTEPEAMGEVEAALSGIEKVEVGGMIDDRRLVVIISASSEEEVRSLTALIERIDGVVGISTAYQHFESPEGKG